MTQGLTQAEHRKERPGSTDRAQIKQQPLRFERRTTRTRGRETFFNDFFIGNRDILKNAKSHRLDRHKPRTVKLNIQHKTNGTVAGIMAVIPIRQSSGTGPFLSRQQTRKWLSDGVTVSGAATVYFRFCRLKGRTIQFCGIDSKGNIQCVMQVVQGPSKQRTRQNCCTYDNSEGFADCFGRSSHEGLPSESQNDLYTEENQWESGEPDPEDTPTSCPIRESCRKNSRTKTSAGFPAKACRSHKYNVTRFISYGHHNLYQCWPKVPQADGELPFLRISGLGFQKASTMGNFAHAAW